jgi:hypothetical protein
MGMIKDSELPDTSTNQPQDSNISQQPDNLD